MLDASRLLYCASSGSSRTPVPVMTLGDVLHLRVHAGGATVAVLEILKEARAKWLVDTGIVAAFAVAAYRFLLWAWSRHCRC